MTSEEILDAMIGSSAYVVRRPDLIRVRAELAALRAKAEAVGPVKPAAVVLWHPGSRVMQHMEQFESAEDGRRFEAETGGRYTPIDEVRWHPASEAAE